MSSTLAEIDVRMRALHDAGDRQAVATLAVMSHGADVQAYLHRMLRTETLAEEAYPVFLERFWKSLSTFAWDCPMRPWMFKVANAVVADTLDQQRRQREVPCPDDAAVWQVAELLRTTTAVFQQTGTKDRLRALREKLSEREQQLLVLRLDHQLSMREIAIATGTVEASANTEQLEAAALRLRHQFSETKLKLRRLAQAEGLLAADAQ